MLTRAGLTRPRRPHQDATCQRPGAALADVVQMRRSILSTALNATAATRRLPGGPLKSTWQWPDAGTPKSNSPTWPPASWEGARATLTPPVGGEALAPSAAGPAPG